VFLISPPPKKKKSENISFENAPFSIGDETDMDVKIREGVFETCGDKTDGDVSYFFYNLFTKDKLKKYNTDTRLQERSQEKHVVGWPQIEKHHHECLISLCMWEMGKGKDVFLSI
jgi:hypothetical protein